MQKNRPQATRRVKAVPGFPKEKLRIPVPKNLVYPVVAAMVFIGITAFVWPHHDNEASVHTSAQSIAIADLKVEPLNLQLQLEAASELTEPEPPSELDVRTITVKNGDSMSLIFDRAGLGPSIVHQLAYESEHGSNFSKILPGKQFHFYFDENNQIQKVVYEVSRLEQFEALKNDAGFATRHIQLEPEIFTSVKSGEIDSSFYLDGLDAGLSDNLIMQLTSIFGWDIDFALEIRQGDQFSVLFEEKYLDGEYLGTGRILAAEFINRGKAVQAVRYEDSDGKVAYYTPEGRSMRKAFLRLPVKFSRVSSNFNPRRLHPVTGQVRPHRGVDYATPSGTPVYATGDGKVITSAYDNYNGNYIVIRHGQTYQTKYLHLSKRNVRVGQTVSQGQTIGLSGATGRVTGAHLHYEFLVNGVHTNPRTVSLPNGMPINASEIESFKLVTRPLLAKLEVTKDTIIAQSSNQALNDS